MIDPKAAMEFIGTAILVFTIQVSVGFGTDIAPLAIGLMLVAIVFAGNFYLKKNCQTIFYI